MNQQLETPSKQKMNSLQIIPAWLPSLNPPLSLGYFYIGLLIIPVSKASKITLPAEVSHLPGQGTPASCSLKGFSTFSTISMPNSSHLGDDELHQAQQLPWLVSVPGFG